MRTIKRTTLFQFAITTNVCHMDGKCAGKPFKLAHGEIYKSLAV